MIKLPSLKWFLGEIPLKKAGNVYSGSIGCDPYYGMKSDMFRYRVWIDKINDANNNESLILKAIHYNGINAFEETDKNLMTEKDFEATDEGVIKAENWIKAEFGALKT